MDATASHGRLSQAGREFVARRHKLLIDGQWVGDVLEAHADELAELEALDNGKPIRDVRAVDTPFGCEPLPMKPRS